MKQVFLFILLFTFSIGNSQSLPIDFESSVTTSDFIDFDGGTATVLTNPQPNGINASMNVAQIVRNGGQIFAGSKIELDNNLDFSTLSVITMKVYTSAPIGTTVKFKLEGAGAAERDAQTTVSNEWEELRWDFTGTPSDFDNIVFMFDFGNIGDGSANSTFLFDDVEQLFAGAQIDLPVDFESADVNYTITPFEGAISFLAEDPTDASNTVVQVIKNAEAGTSAGTTIGTNAGFATDIPLTLTDSKMNARVWSPDAGIPVRLKVEDSNDPTRTCETQTNTTISQGWEVIEFDFTNEALGTESLGVGLSMGWTYNMASIFFNFGTDGATAGEKTYYFDDVKFGEKPLSTSNQEIKGLTIFPNPSNNHWTLTSEYAEISSIEIYDLQGKLMIQQNPRSKVVRIDAQTLTSGMYIAKISTTESISTIRLLKK